MRMPRWFERRIRVVRNRVLVNGNARLAERGLGFAAEHALGEDIDQHQVRIRATGNDAEALRLHRFCQHACVGDDLRRILLEVRLQALRERTRPSPP